MVTSSVVLTVVVTFSVVPKLAGTFSGVAPLAIPLVWATLSLAHSRVLLTLWALEALSVWASQALSLLALAALRVLLPALVLHDQVQRPRRLLCLLSSLSLRHHRLQAWTPGQG